ncbi:hypothetical protein [Sulfitobacter sp.]|uniref:hypothetical protein n=1 Tax=Sulfitobacter sp. TaxID=1903071 RepID=UPI003001617C
MAWFTQNNRNDTPRMATHRIAINKRVVLAGITNQHEFQRGVGLHQQINCAALVITMRTSHELRWAEAQIAQKHRTEKQTSTRKHERQEMV